MSRVTWLASPLVIPFPDIKVTITIQYSPPAGVTLTPPNYRADTSVSLRCDAVGTVGSVSYQWSSTCGSSCFVSGSSQTVSRDKLWSYDAGQHTCVATDGVGNTGSATIEMNVIGKYWSEPIDMLHSDFPVPHRCWDICRRKPILKECSLVQQQCYSVEIKILQYLLQSVLYVQCIQYICICGLPL